MRRSRRSPYFLGTSCALLGNKFNYIYKARYTATSNDLIEIDESYSCFNCKYLLYAVIYMVEAQTARHFPKGQSSVIRVIMSLAFTQKGENNEGKNQT